MNPRIRILPLQSANGLLGGQAARRGQGTNQQTNRVDNLLSYSNQCLRNLILLTYEIVGKYLF